MTLKQIITPILLTAGIVTAPAALADVTDSEMQRRLSDVGVYLDPHATGMQVCGQLRAQPTAAGVDKVLATYQEKYSQFQAGVIIGASVKLYCPEMTAALNAWLVSKGAKPLPRESVVLTVAIKRLAAL